MLQGECVLTYNWGNNFKRYLEAGSQIAGKYGVAPTPGSSQVLDRATMKFVQCTKELCPYGEYFEDIGWVNRAPYMAFGGWACAVNNYTDPVAKRLATEFCAFAASKTESIKNIIPNATAADVNGQDSFRRSHLNLEDYVAAGYERETAMQYIDTLSAGLDSDNVVADIRFPKSEEIYAVLDYEFFDHLRSFKNGTLAEDRARVRRREVGAHITNQWQEIIRNYNGRLPILEAYQRLRDAYSPTVNMNQLDGIRAYGYILVALIFLCSIGFGGWSIRYRKSQIVRASQPFFLVMLCAGTMVLGSAIIPLGIDDGDSTLLSCSLMDNQSCDRACMSIPWLLALGWSIVFSALFSKLWRVNIVYKHSMKFRRLKVSEKDVLLPFVVIFSCNLLLLIIWTAVEPLYWDRISVSNTESYGTCSASSSSNAWKGILIVLGIVNGAALILANIEAYKARRITTEYGESKHIAMIMGSILQVIIVGLPLLFLVDDNPTASYFIRSSIVFVICMSILLLIFVPKVQTWLKKQDARKNTASRKSGLRYQIYDDPTLVAERAAKLDDYRLKVVALEELMMERGYEAKELFDKVGLGNSSAEVAGATGSRYQAFPNTSTSSRVGATSSILDYEQPISNLDKKTAEETVTSDCLPEEKEGGEVRNRGITFACAAETPAERNMSSVDEDVVVEEKPPSPNTEEIVGDETDSEAKA